MAATPLDISLQSALEVMSFLSGELALFITTVFFAIILKSMSRSVSKKGGGKLLKGCADGVPGAKKPRAASPRTAAAMAAGNRQAAPHPRRRGGAVAVVGVADNSVRRQEPWVIIDTIMTHAQDHMNQRTAAQCLQLYSELRQSLGISAKPAAGESERNFVCEGRSGTCLAAAAQRSRHTAGDLYCFLVHCAVRSGQCHLVETLTDDMESQGIARSFAYYESAMKQLAGQKQYHLALSTYDRLCADGFSPSALMLNCIINFASEVNDSDQALTFYEQLCKVSTPSIRASMSVLGAVARRQDWLGSLAMFRRMLERDVKVDALAINVILSTGICAGRLDEVEALLLEAEQFQPPIADRISYNTLVKGYAQRGDAAAALATVERMRRLGHEPNAITFNTLMDALVRGQELLRVIRVLAEMREGGIRPDKFSCTIVVKGLPSKPMPEYTRAAVDVLQESGSCCDTALLTSLYHTVFDAAAQADNALVVRTVSGMRSHGIPLSESENECFHKALAARRD